MLRSVIHRTRPVCSRASRRFSEWTHGQVLLGDSPEFDDEPKVVLEGYSSSGFDVMNVIEKIEKDKKSEHSEQYKDSAESGKIHMMGSIMAFPNSCFIWNVNSIEEVTIESLAPVILYRPRLEYLFIGSERPMNREALEKIKSELKEKANIVVEQLSIGNAMGTFNILNGEGRLVGAAFVLHDDDAD
jgi:uncharacterized protein